MTRKNINDIIKIILPVSSSIIGAPRRVSEMNSYLRTKEGAGVIYSKHLLDFSNECKDFPSFFKSHDLKLQHFTYTAKLNSARVWGRNGAVIGKGDFFITDVSHEFNKELNVSHSIFYTIKQAKIRFFNDNVAVIGTAGANVYFHWMLDILPRLAILSEQISLSSINYFVTEFTGLPYQVETLEKVGIPLDQIIPSNENNNFHIKADALWVPSLSGAFLQPNLFQIAFLTSLYKDIIDNNAPFRKLYISRKKTRGRSIVNEDELVAFLSTLEFEVIYCEELTVAEQVKLFSQAAAIVSSHGSALTNIVFCKPCILVVDIFNQSHVNACFWFISKILSLNYKYLSGSSVPMDNNPKNDRTLVDISDVKRVLEKFN